MDTTTIIIVANLCINKIRKSISCIGKSLTDPNKKALKKQNKINKLQSKLNSNNKQTEVKSIY